MKIKSIILSGTMLALTMVSVWGCSSGIETDMKTNVVKIDGVRVDELVKKLGLDNTFEVSVDPDTGAVAIDGTPINELGKENDKAKTSDDETKDDSVSENVVEYKLCGVTMTLPGDIDDTIGAVDKYELDLDYAKGVYVVYNYYIGVSKEWMESLGKEATEEDNKKMDDCSVELPYIWCVNRNTDLDMVQEIAEDNGIFVKKENFSKIGEEGDNIFYEYFDPGQKNIKNLDPDFKEEFDSLCESFDDAVKKAQIYEPVNPYAGMIGKKLEFTTTDLDGNEIESRDLFSKNEITILNIWATWCPPCKKEIPELEKIDERIDNKNCAVVGLLYDGDDPEKIRLAKTILEDSNADYENIVPWEGGVDNDLLIRSLPTTYFVDRDGIIVASPVVGAQIKAYERTLTGLLGEEETEDDSRDIQEITPNGLDEYRVFVADEDGEPVKGIMVQLCDDSTCRVQKTDEKGLASFKTKKDEYEIHIPGVPNEFAGFTETINVPAEYCDAHITLERK